MVLCDVFTSVQLREIHNNLDLYLNTLDQADFGALYAYIHRKCIGVYIILIIVECSTELKK